MLAYMAKKHFAEVTKVKDLEMGDHPELPKWAQHNQHESLKAVNYSQF